MSKMLCPYKVKITHVPERFDQPGEDITEFCECDYDVCYFFTTHSSFNGGLKVSVPECKRVNHDCEVN